MSKKVLKLDYTVFTPGGRVDTKSAYDIKPEHFNAKLRSEIARATYVIYKDMEGNETYIKHKDPRVQYLIDNKK